MNDNVIKLVVSNEEKPEPVRACATCRYRYRDFGSYRCGAVEMYCTLARVGECNEGDLWEPREQIAPTIQSIWIRIKTWIFGNEETPK